MRLQDLPRLAEEDLREYVRDRIFYRRLDPPLSPQGDEIAITFLQNGYRLSRDAAFHTRLRTVVSGLIREIIAGGTLELRQGPTADALFELITLAAYIEARETLPWLLRLAYIGRASGAESLLAEPLEERLLAVIAKLQPMYRLHCLWADLWRQQDSTLWVLAFNGMSRCDPGCAMEWLPELVRRSDQSSDIDLSLLLWGLLKQPNAAELLRSRWGSFDSAS